MRSTYVLLAGDAERAGDLAEEALKVGVESGQPDALPSLWYAGLLSPIRWHQGRLAEQITPVAGSLADNPASRSLRAGLARIYTDAGLEGDAQALLAAETAAGFPEEHDGVKHVSFNSPTFWAEAAAQLGDAAAAERLYERLAPWSGQSRSSGTTGVYGAVAHYLGHLATVLGRYDTSEAHFVQALAVHERLLAPFHIARTHLEWGRMRLVRGQPGDDRYARAHLESALDLALQYGCALVEQRAVELLKQL